MKSERAVSFGGAQAYSAKDPSYFAGLHGARTDYVEGLPNNLQARILEIGCGDGTTGELALRQGKCGVYCGVELCQAAADRARGKITELLVGNVESQELLWPAAFFDVLILSEVLEHLVDPWAVLRKIRPLMKPGARVFASSPNISHYSVIFMLISGEWNLADSGIMDRTHLRWFTPKAYKALFESCDYVVDSVGHVGKLSRKAMTVSLLSFGALRHFFIEQVNLEAHCR